MDDRSGDPIGRGFEWAGRVFAAVAMMCLPGLAGQWLDERWQIHGLAVVGFALGLVGSMAYLIAATRAMDRDQKRSVDGDKSEVKGPSAAERDRDR